MMNISLQAESTVNRTEEGRALAWLSLEMMLYIVLFLAALGLRVGSLDAVALNETEAHEALAALHRVDSDMTTSPAIANNPLMAFSNQLTFFLMEASTPLARLSTALVGALMVWGPYLWRRHLGVTGALAASLFLALSPVALAASRTMGGAVWTMTLVFIMLWLLIRFYDTRDNFYAILTTMTLGAIAVLAESTGLLTLLALFFGFILAWLSKPKGDTDDELKTAVQDVLYSWPWRDSLVATAGLIVVIGTGFFASPAGLTSVGNTIFQLFEGFTTRPEDVPAAYVLLVALRYDLGLILFALVALYFAFAEDVFFARMLAGWFALSTFWAVVYQDAQPDMALWMVVPAALLTGMLVQRMLSNPSIGYWVVPNWGVPVHALATAALLTAVALNGVRISHTLFLETRPFGYHVLDDANSDAKIGSFDSTRLENTFEIQANQEGVTQPGATPVRISSPLSFTLQIKRIDDEISPIVRLEDAQGEILYGPVEYPGGRQGLVIDNVVIQPGQQLFLKVNNAALDSTGQFVVLTHPEGAADSNLPINLRLDLPEFWTVIRALSNQQLPPFTIMITVFLVLLVMIAYFLAGSIWGSRAAWRGLGFGILIYTTIYGLGLGWQASVSFAEDPRELWQTNPAPERVNRLVETLEDMSFFANGMKTEIDITVLGENDSALAWALRNFDDVQYVNSVGIETDTQAVLVPYEQHNVILGADYVGQDFELGRSWSVSQLAWVDFVSWLGLRETRFEPRVDDHYMLWVRRDVYGVQEVIATQSEQ